MENDETGQGNPEPLHAPVKKVWKAPEMVVIHVNDDIQAVTWPGSGGVADQGTAPALYKRIKAVLPLKIVDEE